MLIVGNIKKQFQKGRGRVARDYIEYMFLTFNKHIFETYIVVRLQRSALSPIVVFLVNVGQNSDGRVSSGEPVVFNPHRGPADGAHSQMSALGAHHSPHATMSTWSIPSVLDGDYLK